MPGISFGFVTNVRLIFLVLLNYRIQCRSKTSQSKALRFFETQNNSTEMNKDVSVLLENALGFDFKIIQKWYTAPIICLLLKAVLNKFTM